MILSDRKITELCVKPLCRYRTAVFSNGEFINSRTEDFFFGTEEDFEKFIVKQKEEGLTVLRFTESPHDVPFRPMISPFSPNQVREVKILRSKMDQDRRELYDYDIAVWLGENLPAALSAPIISAMKKNHWTYPLSSILETVIGHQVELNKLTLQVGVAISSSIALNDLVNAVYDNVLELDNVPSEPIISYGLSSYGYDLRLGNKFKVFTNVNSTVINPKAFDKRSFVDFEGDVCIVPPNSFVLGASLERMAMPKDVTGVVLGKSTYARCGIDCLATPLEAGWEGHVTLEFANTTPLPAMLFAGEGCCQVLFLKGDPCDVTYAMRSGKYQNQEAGPVTPRV